jgi:hypothetical protein
MLVFALMLGALPRLAQAKYQNLSGSLPGTGMSTAEEVGIIGGGAALAAVVVIAIWRHKKKENAAAFTAPPFHFRNDARQQPGMLSVGRRSGNDQAVTESAPARPALIPGEMAQPILQPAEAAASK